MRAGIMSRLLDEISRRIAPWQPSRVTRADARLAYVVAVTVDVAQFLFGPFGWAGFDEILDAIGVVVISRLIGFHPLLLPTFVLEFVPLTDMLPTWTGCVALVMRARKRQGVIVEDGPPAIDIKAHKVE
jgi:hypothetical protein